MLERMDAHFAYFRRSSISCCVSPSAACACAILKTNVIFISMAKVDKRRSAAHCMKMPSLAAAVLLLAHAGLVAVEPPGRQSIRSGQGGAGPNVRARSAGVDALMFPLRGGAPAKVERVEAGDWGCGKCGKSNFRRREKCFVCAAPKPLYEGTSTAVAGQVLPAQTDLRAEIERGRRIALGEASKWSSPVGKRDRAWWHAAPTMMGAAPPHLLARPPPHLGAGAPTVRGQRAIPQPQAAPPGGGAPPAPPLPAAMPVPAPAAPACTAAAAPVGTITGMAPGPTAGTPAPGLAMPPRAAWPVSATLMDAAGPRPRDQPSPPDTSVREAAATGDPAAAHAPAASAMAAAQVGSQRPASPNSTANSSTPLTGSEAETKAAGAEAEAPPRPGMRNTSLALAPAEEACRVPPRTPDWRTPPPPDSLTPLEMEAHQDAAASLAGAAAPVGCEGDAVDDVGAATRTVADGSVDGIASAVATAAVLPQVEARASDWRRPPPAAVEVAATAGAEASSAAHLTAVPAQARPSLLPEVPPQASPTGECNLGAVGAVGCVPADAAVAGPTDEAVSTTTANPYMQTYHTQPSTVAVDRDDWRRQMARGIAGA